MVIFDVNAGTRREQECPVVLAPLCMGNEAENNPFFQLLLHVKLSNYFQRVRKPSVKLGHVTKEEQNKNSFSYEKIVKVNLENRNYLSAVLGENRVI